MRPDWNGTARGVITGLPRLLRNLRPTFRLTNVRQIDRAFLHRHGIRGVVWDVDGTLMGYHAHEVALEFRDHVRALFADETLRHAVVSNCDEARFAELIRILPEATLLRLYDTPAGPVTRTVREGVDSLGESRPPAGSATRKPSAALVRAAATVLGDLAPGELLVVGDQYVTDVASANLAGAQSVKVPTYRPETFPLIVQLGQRLEAIVAGERSSAHPILRS